MSDLGPRIVGRGSRSYLRPFGAGAPDSRNCKGDDVPLKRHNYTTSLFALAIAASLTASTAACSSAPPPETNAPTIQAAPTLLPGDAVRIQVWREEDISGTFTVDDRGVVTLPLLGTRRVTGLEPAELRDALLSDYTDYLQNPSIEVTILRRINILGEVRSPGLYPVDATISLADALALAGGITPTGNPDKIQLIRDNQVIAKGISQASLIGASDIRSGDQLVVGQKSWFSRNTGVILGSFIAATAVVTAALINNQ
jgi:polysaccharide export outer membrane protein